MSLDFYLTAARPSTVFEYNITHNLSQMARFARVYEALWRPEENGITKASQLVAPLRAGLVLLLADPDKFRKWDSPNGWGRYEHLVKFVQECLEACERNPDADVSVSR